MVFFEKNSLIDEHMMYITEVEEDHHWVMHLAGALNDARKKKGINRSRFHFFVLLKKLSKPVFEKIQLSNRIGLKGIGILSPRWQSSL